MNRSDISRAWSNDWLAPDNAILMTLPAAPQSPWSTTCWKAALASCSVSELDRPAGLAGMPLAREQLEAYVLTSLLYAGRHQFSDALSGGEDTRRLGRPAPVVQYIDDHADEELTPELLARVGCVSVRTLHAAFQQQLGESPMAYVRGIRLSRVRTELLAGDPEQVRVTDIALRWGFLHHHSSHHRRSASVRLQNAGIPRCS